MLAHDIVVFSEADFTQDPESQMGLSGASSRGSCSPIPPREMLLLYFMAMLLLGL